MKPTEEPMAQGQAEEAEKRSRRMLVEATAIGALVESGCLTPKKFLPLMLRELKAIHTGEGELGVFAIDGKGEIRQGPRGAVTAADLAAELRKDPAFYEIGWIRRQTQEPGKRDREEMKKWQ